MRELEARVYPPDALAGRADLDVIPPAVAATLDAQFRERLRRCPDKVAFTEYDRVAQRWRDYTWRDTAAEVSRWQQAMVAEGLQQGDRVALRLRNCRHWVIFDQAALGLGMVVVPLYVADRPDNVNYILDHSDTRLLLVEDAAAWLELAAAQGDTPQLQRVISIVELPQQDGLLRSAGTWLGVDSQELVSGRTEPDQLASIVYTSGTTGKPKGVMLSHENMVSNAYAGLRSVAIEPDDLLLSFLPLSHTLERTVGYYVALMAGAQVAYNRSIPQLAEDMAIIRPTGVITVPRIFERLYSKLKTRLAESSLIARWLFQQTVEIGWARFEYRQGRGRWHFRQLLWPLLDILVAGKVRARLGGRLRLAVVGGAPCPPAVSRVFIALGIDLLQGYGLTESSPSISINTRSQNRPATIGLPLHGVEVRIGDHDELLTRGPNVMMGYWKNEQASRAVLSTDGWLYTGDQARIEDGFITIVGRIKDILVLANGEKVSPADMESAVAEDPLFEQIMVVGEQMPFLTALVVLNSELWRETARQLGVASHDACALLQKPVEQALLQRINGQVHDFPAYAKVRRITAMLEPWTVEAGLLTPTLKMKRPRILAHCAADIARMYEGHEIYRANVARSA